VEPQVVAEIEVGFTEQVVVILVRYAGVVVGEGIEALPIRDEG